MKVQIQCANCGKYWLTENPVMNAFGELECPLCNFQLDSDDIELDNNPEYFWCDACDEYHPINEIIGDDEPICANCFQLRYCCGVSDIRIGKCRANNKQSNIRTSPALTDHEVRASEK